MTVVTFWLRDPLEDAEFKWSFDPGHNILHVYDVHMVDRILARLVDHGAIHVKAYLPGVDPGVIDPLLLSTGQQNDVEHFSVAYEHSEGT